ncbi:MAG: tRNA lysidine(34) synthetase TilS [Anaerolineae bacterium]
MDLVERVQDTIQREELLAEGDVVVVGVSGGPDSLCLLHVLKTLAPEHGWRLIAAHLHHGIRGHDADEDAAFVERIARAWGIPCEIGHVDVPAIARERRLAVEEAARRVRYSFLGQVARQHGAASVAVAHHADDQAETVLMHFLRGAGISGLRGMLYRTPWGDYRLLEPQPPAEGELPRWLIRPLLDATREEIEAYCRQHDITPRFDISNLDQTYYRNRLRHELLPILETYNPAIRQILCRTAAVMADDYQVLRDAVERAWRTVERPALRGGIAFDREAWRALPRSLQRATLREAARRLRRTLRDVNFVHIDQAVRVAAEGETGEKATLPMRLMVFVDYGRIEVADEDARVRMDAPQVQATSELPCPGTLELGHGWVIECRPLDASELPEKWDHNPDRWAAWLDAEAVGDSPIVRGRRAGDRFQPLGMGGRWVRLNEFMINVKMPVDLRDRWPLVEGRFGIAWVAGYRVDERARIRPETKRVLAISCYRREQE